MSTRYAEQFREAELPSAEDLNAMQHDVESVVLEEGPAAGTALGVRETLVENRDATVLWLPPITDDVARADTEVNNGSYAHVANVDVFGIDFGNMGRLGTRPDREVRQALSAGSFVVQALRQWDALEKFLDKRHETFDSLGRIIMFGSSGGGPQVLAMFATRPDEAQVTDVVLSSVPYFRDHRQLAQGFAKAGADEAYYVHDLDDDEAMHGPRESFPRWLGRSALRAGANARMWRALGHKRSLEVTPLLRPGDVRFHMYASEHDRVAPPDDTMAAHQYLVTAGEVRHAAVTQRHGEHHAFQLSRKAMGSELKEVVESYDTTG